MNRSKLLHLLQNTLNFKQLFKSLAAAITMQRRDYDCAQRKYVSSAVAAQVRSTG